MKRILTTICAAVASTAVTAVFTPASEAAFVEPTTWDRGLEGATYQYWDVFFTTTDATPTLHENNVNQNEFGTATLSETTGDAVALINSGNIYNSESASIFEVDIPTQVVSGFAPDHNAIVMVQIATLGKEIDTDSVLVNGHEALSYTELSSGDSGSERGGSSIESWFLFFVPFESFGLGVTPFDVVDLNLTFAAEEQHLSLDKLAVDVTLTPAPLTAEPTPIVPEPASLAILGSACLLATQRRRKAS